MTNKTLQLLAGFVLGVLVLQPVPICWAAESPDFRTANLEQLIVAARQESNPNSETSLAIADRAVELLLAQDLQNPAAEATVRQLVELAQPVLGSLTPERQAQLRSVLAASANNSARLSLGQLQTAVKLLEGIGEPKSSIQNLVQRWLSGHPIEQLGLEEAEWCLRKCLPGMEERTSFSATWTGRLVPPNTGDYTFSTTPINVNQSIGSQENVRHSIKVVLNEQPVLDATAEKWEFKGKPVRLEGRQAIPIRVEVTYESSAQIPLAPPSALLSWAGPGFSTSIVPAEAFRQPQRDEKGLLAEYRWERNGRPEVVTQVNENIDFAWPGPSEVAPSNPDLIARLTDRLWELATAPDYLAQCASGAVTHVYLQDSPAAAYLDSDRRRQFLQLVAQQPELLQRAEGGEVLNAYRQFRFGAEEDALDLLGTWMQLHADVAPKITVDFYRQNRQLFAELAVYLARQLPDHYQMLQEQFLEMSDGRCALPVAYTLTYSYQLLPPELDLDNRSAIVPVTDWLQLLEAKANDESLIENARVNWLIARAQAAEGGPALSERAAGTANYLAGLPWLNQAHLVADDDATLARIFREKAARLVAKLREKQFRELLSSAAGKVPPAELRAWSQQMAANLQARQARIAADALQRRRAYVAELQRRRERAEARNDSQGIARYDSLIQRATAVSE